MVDSIAGLFMITFFGGSCWALFCSGCVSLCLFSSSMLLFVWDCFCPLRVGLVFFLSEGVLSFIAVLLTILGSEQEGCVFN
jgi:hypothetical protein